MKLSFIKALTVLIGSSRGLAIKIGKYTFVFVVTKDPSTQELLAMESEQLNEIDDRNFGHS